MLTTQQHLNMQSMSKHFDICWPEEITLRTVFPEALPSGFNPLFKGLQNLGLSNGSNKVILQSLPGANFHFAHLQSDLQHAAEARIQTQVPSLLTVINQVGCTAWDFAGQESERIHTEPGTYFSVALPAGSHKLYLPENFVQFQCFIMTGFRLKLLAKDLPRIQPVLQALEAGDSGTTLQLATCSTLKEMQDLIRYLQNKKLREESSRNVLYKNRLHRLLRIYDAQLEVWERRLAGSQDRLYADALEVMANHPPEQRLTLAALANTLMVGERTLQYAFQANGTTFSDTLTQLKNPSETLA